MRNLLFMLGIFVLGGSPAFAASGVSGWPIFKRINPVQFHAIAAVFPEHAGVSAILSNPASVDSTGTKGLSFISEAGFAGDAFGTLLYRVPLRQSALTAGLAYYDAGSVELNWVDAGGLETKNVALQRDAMAVVSLARKLSPSLYGGVTLKGAYSDVAETKSALAAGADAGVVYTVDKFSFAFAAQNFGAATPFVDKADPLPSLGYAGIGYAWERERWHLLAALGASYYLADETAVPEAGVEAGWGILSLNAGYRHADEEGKLHLGMEILIGDCSFGYAFLPGIYLGPVHRLEIACRFGTPAAPERETRKTAPAPAPAVQKQPADVPRKAPAPAKQDEPPKKKRFSDMPMWDSKPWYK